ncbi:hypothetical protein [Sporosarcina sp. ITBMC105]
MTEKVKVTQRQADWLDRYKNEKEIAYAIDIQPHKKRPDSPIVDWPASKVAEALYRGYEVEEEYEQGDWLQEHHGNIGIVTKVEGSKVWGYWNGSNFEAFAFKREIVKKLTPEEIKAEQERRVWARIGREVGEFHVGDYGLLGNYIFRKAVEGNDLVQLRDDYSKGKLIGFFPAESFIEFGGGEE